MLIDTHSHLYLSNFKDDIDLVLQNAIKNNVKKILLPNIDASTIDDLLSLSSANKNFCFPMMGLHPTSVKENYKEELNIIYKQLQSNQFIAIGETGIDLYWDKTYKNQQIDTFKTQVEWAKTLQLPIVIHVRNSFVEVFNILDQINDDNLTGVFHCFSGNLQQANKILDYKGFKLGIGGVVTFKNSNLKDVVSNINPEHIVLETDSPFLAPMPFRGKRNESAYLVYIAKKLSEIYSIPISDIESITTRNAIQLFKLNIK